MERLEERYIIEEIDKTMFDKFKCKFIAERSEIYKSLAKNVKKVSNLQLLIDNAITIASKLFPCGIPAITLINRGCKS